MGVTASRTLSVSSPSDLLEVSFRAADGEILDLLYANFHTDEPMSRALAIYDGVNRVPAVDKYTLAALNERMSIMAVDSITDKLLGIAICGRCDLKTFTSPPSSTSLSSQARCNSAGDAKFRHIIGALKEVNRRADRPALIADLGLTDSRYGELALFDIKMVTTDKHNRRSGLGTDLIRRSVRMASEMGYAACKTEATGQYSRKAFERLGFTVASELSYSEVLDPVTGEKVFANMAPAHKGVALLTKRILPEKTEEEEEADDVFKS